MNRLATLVGYSGFVVLGWNAVLVPALIQSIQQDFRQADAAFGLFFFVSALLYAAGSFSGGFLTERVGRRAVLALATLLLGVGLGDEALAPSWLGFLLAALVVNAGAGAIDGGVNALVLDLYPHARGGALNRFHFSFSLGALVSPVVVGQLVAAGLPWRAVVLASGAGIVAFAGLFGAARLPSGRRVRVPVMSPGETFTRAEQSLLPFAGLAIGICCYIAAEMGVSSWLVKSLAGVPVATATAVLSIFWGGSALGRLLSNWIAERLHYGVFTVGCIVGGSVALVAAVLVPLLPLTAALYGLAGLCYGPVYPMILAIGGTIYPRRLAALSGSLGAAAVVGSVVYPPLVGLMATPLGLRAGLVGAGLLGVPTALAIIAAYAVSRRAAAVPEDPALEAAS